MKRLFALAAIVVAQAAFAAELPDAPDAATLAEAKALVAAMHTERQVEGIASAMSKAMSQRFADNPVVNQQAATIMMEESMLAMRESDPVVGSVMDVLVQSYATHFSLDELRQIRAFYESPAGQRMVEVTPKMLGEAMPRVMAIARARIPAACEKAKARLIAEKVANAENMKCQAAQ